MSALRLSTFRLRTLLPALCLIGVAVLPSCAARAPSPHVGDSVGPVGPILQQAEGLFRYMRARDYPAIWALLSARSRETIVSDVERESGRLSAGPVDPGNIERDFARGGTIARAYWEGYLREFDPEAALRESRWEMGNIEGDSAEIRIIHEGADRPAVLRMVREEGVWKVGLIETFRPRPLQ